MPILDLQKRVREAGRIRIGEQVATGNQGKTRPVKLDRFRLTSQDQAVLAAAGSLYGGEPRRWEGAPVGEQWELYTTTAAIDVVVPPSDMGFSQWYEQWGNKVCKARCDGQQMVTPRDQPCICDPENRACAMHTRMSVMLRDLPGFGLWRLDTSGYYAATELAGAVEVCEMAAARGAWLPARLLLEQRTATRADAQGKVSTYKFAVPVLDVGIAPAALIGGASVQPVAIGGQAVAELEPPAPANLTPVPQPALPSVSVADQVAATKEQVTKPRANAAAKIPPSGLKPRTAAEAAVQDAPEGPAPSGVSTGAGGSAAPGPVCSECGSPIGDLAATKKAGKIRHKVCPPGQAAVPMAVGGDDPDVPGVTLEPDQENDPGSGSVVDAGEGEPAGGTAVASEAPEPAAARPNVPSKQKRIARLHALCTEAWGGPKPHNGDDRARIDRNRHALCEAVTKGATSSSSQLGDDALEMACSHLEDMIAGRSELVEAPDGGWEIVSLMVGAR